MLSFFLRGVLDEILNLIESVSEDFPSYSSSAGRPTILITVGQGSIALAVGTGGGGLDIFTLICPFSSFSLSLGDGPMARYRLKYCLKGPLNSKQPTNHLCIYSSSKHMTMLS